MFCILAESVKLCQRHVDLSNGVLSCEEDEFHRLECEVICNPGFQHIYDYAKSVIICNGGMTTPKFIPDCTGGLRQIMVLL